MSSKKAGRPTDYSLELAEKICDAVANNSKGIKKLCSENEHWPCSDTIYHWQKIHPEFSDQYARAKEAQIETLVDEILDIADDTSHDTITKVGSDGNVRKVCNNEWINRSRLRIDTRKWLAAKLCPRLYGDKPDDKPSSKPMLEINTTDPIEAARIYQRIMLEET